MFLNCLVSRVCTLERDAGDVQLTNHLYLIRRMVYRAGNRLDDDLVVTHLLFLHVEGCFGGSGVSVEVE